MVPLILLDSVSWNCECAYDSFWQVWSHIVKLQICWPNVLRHTYLHPNHRWSPRNISLMSTQHVLLLKLGLHDPDKGGPEMTTCALCKICVHKLHYGVTLSTPYHWLHARCTNKVLLPAVVKGMSSCKGLLYTMLLGRMLSAFPCHMCPVSAASTGWHIWVALS